MECIRPRRASVFNSYRTHLAYHWQETQPLNIEYFYFFLLSLYDSLTLPDDVRVMVVGLRVISHRSYAIRQKSTIDDRRMLGVVLRLPRRDLSIIGPSGRVRGR